MAAINFFNEDISFKPPKPAILRQWLQSAAKSEGFKIKSLNYVFVSDEYLHQMNKSYLNHHTLTDIITFDNSESEVEVEGDIFISIPRIKDNAGKFNESFDRELCRVLIHGLLHLMGYDDKKASGKKEMRNKENSYLSLL